MLLQGINDISVPWLNQVMDTNSITGFEARRVGEGVGLMGILAIVTLESEDDSIPPTIVVKIQTTDEQNLAVADTYRTYPREVSFKKNSTVYPLSISSSNSFFILIFPSKKWL